MRDIIFSGHQPNFLPYMGFFYKMYNSDKFVLDDDVQYSKGQYHNFNFIRIAGKKYRITVPVTYKYGDLIKDVKICYDRSWHIKLLKTMQVYYHKSPFFDVGYDFLERHLLKKKRFLCELNCELITEIADKFGFNCRLFIASEDVPTNAKSNERNIQQCKKLCGNIYYSGIGGKAYNDIELYTKNGIKVIYSDYEPVKYWQPGNEFLENLSVIDYIFSCGFQLPERWKR